jgi:phosphoribosylpyrophosphate synthetase
LDEVYRIDLQALVVEIDTEDIKSRLFSPAREPGHHHIATFDLHDPEIRRSFFNLMNVDGGPNARTFSGPLY